MRKLYFLCCLLLLTAANGTAERPGSATIPGIIGFKLHSLDYLTRNPPAYLTEFAEMLRKSDLSNYEVRLLFMSGRQELKRNPMIGYQRAEKIIRLLRAGSDTPKSKFAVVDGSAELAGDDNTLGMVHVMLREIK